MLLYHEQCWKSKTGVKRKRRTFCVMTYGQEKNMGRENKIRNFDASFVDIESSL